MKTKSLVITLIITLFCIGMTSCRSPKKECEHNYSSEVIAPTCSEEGYTKHICSVCGDSYNDTETPKIEHTYVGTVVAPTCVAEGYTSYECSACGYSYNSDTVPVSAHLFIDDTCDFCDGSAPEDVITANTDWYQDGKIVFTLSSKEELAGLAALVNSGTDFTDCTIYLGADIDLGWCEWTPIGNAENSFNGTFDGDGYTISSLKINANGSYVGLFGNSVGKLTSFEIDNASVYAYGAYQYISVVCGYTSGEITDVIADGYILAESSSNVGGIIGTTTAKVSNVSSYVNVAAGDYTGGIAGSAAVSGVVYSELYNYGEVTGAAYTGGLFGHISGVVGSTITSSSSSGKIVGTYGVGAIAGKADNVSIESCSNEGSEISATSSLVSGSTYLAYLGGYVGCGYIVNDCVNLADINYTSKGLYVGGIAGYLAHSINNCSNSGDISGFDRVGGLAGHIQSTGALTITSLTNEGKISGKSYVGGICGSWSYSTAFILNNCENSGAVSGEAYLGGIVGSLSYSTENQLTVYGLSNTGDVAGTDGNVGGLFGFVAGSSASVIQDSASAANITGLYCVGGLIGQSSKVTLKDSSNEGSTVTATGFTVEGTLNSAYLGGYVGKGYSVFGCENNVSINYTSIGRFVGGVIGYISDVAQDCTNNGDIYSRGAYVGGITGSFVSSQHNRTNQNLTNTGNIRGSDHVGGIFGAINQSSTAKGSWYKDGAWRYHYYQVSSYFTNLSNSGNITSDAGAGGIIGYAYFVSTYYAEDFACCSPLNDCYFYGDFRMVASNFTNTGVISGKGNAGQLIGYFDSDAPSTITTYTVTGSVYNDGTLVDGDKETGTKYDLTLSGKVIPEPEEPETPEDNSTEEGTEG